MVKLFTLSNCFLAALIGQAAGHFVVVYPPSVGFDDAIEGNAPCGGFSVDFSKDNITDFHVDGDVLALVRRRPFIWKDHVLTLQQSFHPQVTWLFRATLDQTASGNWTNLLPAVQQTGLNNFCEPAVKVPATFAGSKGVIGIAADSPDGILYQVSQKRI